MKTVAFEALDGEWTTFTTIHVVVSRITMLREHERLAIGNTSGPFTSILMDSGQLFVVKGSCAETEMHINAKPSPMQPEEGTFDALPARFNRATVDEIMRLLRGVLPGSNRETARNILLNECKPL